MTIRKRLINAQAIGVSVCPFTDRNVADGEKCRPEKELLVAKWRLIVQLAGTAGSIAPTPSARIGRQLGRCQHRRDTPKWLVRHLPPTYRELAEGGTT